MSETLLVSSRGQITLPANIRKRFGIKSGSVLILEERNNEMVLKPAAIVEMDVYSDKQIADWNRADSLSGNERKKITRKLRKKR